MGHNRAGDKRKLRQKRRLAEERRLAVKRSVFDPTDPQNLLKASGRGILFMRTFMDEVTWERHPAGGTVVRMTKKG